MSAVQFILVAGFVGFVVLIFIVLPLRETWHSIHMLERWADKNGLQLVSSSRCFWTLGTPFAAAGNHPVFRITVEDSVGNGMSGYALCRESFLGLWPESVEVKWDSPGAEKRKNDDLEKPKNDFIKRKNDWDSPDFEESETVDLEDLRSDAVKRKHGG